MDVFYIKYTLNQDCYYVVIKSLDSVKYGTNRKTDQYK